MSPPPESTHTFGVDPAETAALARSWRRHGRVLANLDVDELANTVGAGHCLAAARAAAAPTKRVGVDIANRLDVLGQIVGRFQARAVDDDAAAGRALHGLADR
ncbi:hypothetical protein [Gordonia crocea]|uniref:Uncharacterized protein n=1 Tax=Gordonia crocea TaxID=589162 RepID=A0A7M3SU36_9ACTN|nr:hypothetical protein [Gordonia crocea]GED96160.1 hypothetical protein nbrc107697_01990 [Gordonia crocea]